MLIIVARHQLILMVDGTVALVVCHSTTILNHPDVGEEWRSITTTLAALADRKYETRRWWLKGLAWKVAAVRLLLGLGFDGVTRESGTRFKPQTPY